VNVAGAFDAMIAAAQPLCVHFSLDSFVSGESGHVGDVTRPALQRAVRAP
jgi:hypothetical protein